MKWYKLRCIIILEQEIKRQTVYFTININYQKRTHSHFIIILRILSYILEIYKIIFIMGQNARNYEKKKKMSIIYSNFKSRAGRRGGCGTCSWCTAVLPAGDRYRVAFLHNQPLAVPAVPTATTLLLFLVIITLIISSVKLFSINKIIFKL